MIQTEIRPPVKKQRMQTEHKLQSALVKYFNHNYPSRTGELFATFQETKSKGQGGVMLSLGLIAGVADLLLCDNGVLVGIEVKAPNSSHNIEHLIRQAKWLLKVPKRGYFCDSLDVFVDILEGRDGIDPQIVLDHCLACKKKSLTWCRELFF